MYPIYAQYRDEKGLTDYKVAEMTGIARSTFSEWKRGSYVPKVDKLMKIANLLECPVEELIKRA